jgi:hypothetical protein
MYLDFCIEIISGPKPGQGICRPFVFHITFYFALNPQVTMPSQMESRALSDARETYSRTLRCAITSSAPDARHVCHVLESVPSRLERRLSGSSSEIALDSGTIVAVCITCA